MHLLLLALLIFGCIVTGIFGTKASWGGGKDGLIASSIGLGVLSGILWLFIMVGSITTYSDVKDMVAFYDTTMEAYVWAIEETGNVTIDPAMTRGRSITDFSYLEQGKEVSDRIRDLRDKVTWYNETLISLRKDNTVPILGGMTYDVPDRLKPIKLGEING